MSTGGTQGLEARWDYWMVTSCTSGMRDSRAAIKRFTWHLHGFSPLANGPAGGTTVATTETPVAAWGGRTVLGIRRMTFLLYEAGRMQRIWSTVQPDGYAAEILAAIQGG
jgi:hypothetical protein